MIYLAYVTFVFFIVSLIYQLKVAPTFLGAFETFEISIPSHLLFYRDYWLYFMLVISVLLVVSLIIGSTLRGLFKFKQGRENGLVFRFLVFKGIRGSYLKIIEIINFPVLSAHGYAVSKNNEISVHLSDIQNAGLSLAVEMQALIKSEVQLLLSRCERQMRVISVLVAVIVVVAIFFFLVSAYSPIFVLGETV